MIDKTTPRNKANHEANFDFNVVIFWIVIGYFGCFGLYYGIDFLISLVKSVL